MPDVRSIEERLDAARTRFLDEGFLHNRGLSNEAALHVFQYNPKDEMIIRAFVETLRMDYDGQKVPCRILHFDLFDILLDICRERRILARIPEMEQKRGSAFVQNQIKNVAKAATFIQHMEYGEHHAGDFTGSDGRRTCIPLYAFSLYSEQYSSRI